MRIACCFSTFLIIMILHSLLLTPVSAQQHINANACFMDEDGNPRSDWVSRVVGGSMDEWKPDRKSPGSVTKWYYKPQYSRSTLQVPEGMTLKYQREHGEEVYFAEGGHWFAGGGERIDVIKQGVLYCNPSWYESKEYPIMYAGALLLAYTGLGFAIKALWKSVR